MKVHILYSGQVQGVGFRYTVQIYSQELRLTGWVKNKDNGDVEIEAYGSRQDIEQMCHMVEERFRGYIGNKIISFSPEESKYHGFSIAF